MGVETAGLSVGVAEDEVDADDGAIDGSSGANAETEPSEDEDPLAELRAQVSGAARRDELESLRNQIRSELGRSQRLEARLDALAGGNPLAAVDPRLDASESLLTGIADALIDSDLADDRMKSSLRGARAALESAKGARAQSRMREELRDDILKALPQPAAEPAAAVDDPWAQATVDVYAELVERLPDFDATAIPATVWGEGRAKGSPARAAAYVIRWAEQQAATPAERTAARRQAAGAGAPGRSGSTVTYKSQRELDRAVMDGVLSSQEARAWRDSGRYAALPF